MTAHHNLVRRFTSPVEVHTNVNTLCLRLSLLVLCGPASCVVVPMVGVISDFDSFLIPDVVTWVRHFVHPRHTSWPHAWSSLRNEGPLAQYNKKLMELLMSWSAYKDL